MNPAYESLKNAPNGQYPASDSSFFVISTMRHDSHMGGSRGQAAIADPTVLEAQPAGQ